MTETETLLKNQLLELSSKVENLVKEGINQKLTITRQQHRIDQLLRQLYGVKSEKLAPQPNLFDPLPFTAEELALRQQEAATKTIAEHQRKERKKNEKSLRYELPEHLRREDVVIQPNVIPDGAVQIGEDISEKLEITQAELYVKRTIRPKYALADKSAVVIADLPQAILYRCIAGPSLLIRILIDKYVDHLPLHRQRERFARQGVKISDSTMGDWVTQLATKLELLYQVLEREVLSSRYLGADETTVKVLDRKVHGKCHLGYLWVYMAHEKNLVLFDYDPTRAKSVVGEKLKNYVGYLQSDGYVGYKQFSTHASIQRLGCMAHARRKFDEAMSNAKETSIKALGMMQRIYRLEHWMRVCQTKPEGKQQLRQKIAVPMLNAMFDWMQSEKEKHTPSEKIYKALNYALERKEELMRYTQNGMLHIDNNLVENVIRPTVIGKKNFMFMGSHDGAQRTAMIYSFMLSCKANNINPEEWLADVLSRIDDTRHSQLVDLLPHMWKKETV